jgi:hypothetical protein
MFPMKFLLLGILLFIGYALLPDNMQDIFSRPDVLVALTFGTIMGVGSRRSMSELQDLRNIRKALEANDGATTDITDLQDGAAFGQQFLDKTAVSIVSQDQHFKFLKQAPKRDVDQVIAEYNIYKNHGSSDVFRNSPFVEQSEDPRFDDVVFQRLYDAMCYLAVGFRVNKVITKVRNTQDPELTNANGALKRLLESLSFKIWYGNKSLNINEPDGFVKKISDVSSDHVIDMRGVLPDIGLIADKAAMISVNYFGTVNQMWMSNGTRNLFNQVYHQSGAVTVWQNSGQNPGNIQYGNLINEVLASEALNGKISLMAERWLDRSQIGVSKVIDRNTGLLVESASGLQAPDLPAFVLASAPFPNSKFDASWADDYEYRVSAVRNGQESIAAALQTVTVADGDAVTITITPAVAGEYATSFRIYRKDPDTNTHLFIKEILRDTVNPTTTYVDFNENIPGTSDMVMGDFNSTSLSGEDRTFVLSELLPPMKTLFEPGIGAGLRQQAGMVEYYVVPQILTPQKFVVFKNVPVKQS